MKYRLPTKKIIDFVETGITSPNSLIPVVFGQERCSSKKGALTYGKDIFTIHFILGGKGYLDRREMREGDVILMRAHSHVTYEPDPEDPWVYLWLEFHGLSVERYLEHCGFTDSQDVLHLSDMEPIVRTFTEAFSINGRILNKHAKNMLYVSCGLNLLAAITEECGYLAKNKEKSFQLINYEKILSYINNNYTNPNMNVAAIAKEFSYAPSYLTRLFRKYSDTSPCKYITKIRMEKAVDLMSKHQYNINQISNIVGYQNQFYFSRAFLQYYGIRPSEYQKKKAD